jgi:protoporphyrinogen oxidase
MSSGGEADERCMRRKKVIVAGGGLAGLSAAWHLQQKGQEVLLFEKEPQVGGLCRSKDVAGFTFDHDAHFLHFKHDSTLDLVRSLLKTNLARYSKSSWIYSFGRYTPYPFQANLYGLPEPIVRECLTGFVDACENRRNGKEANFQEWIDRRFGPGIARHFMVPYNTKFWTVPPRQMTCSWLDGFIPLPSLERVVSGAKREYRDPLGYNASFWYPKQGGIGQLAKSLGRLVKNVFTECAIEEIDPKRKVIRTANGEEDYDVLISTLPLPELPNLIPGLPKAVAVNIKKLRWNSIFNLNLGIDRPFDHARHWVYFPEKRPAFFRTGFFTNISPSLAPGGRGSLYSEVAYAGNEPIDKKKIVGRIENGLRKTGILKNGSRILCRDINDIKYGYPIYDKNYAQARQGIIKYLADNDIQACGRYGSWCYFSMEDTILDGKRAAKALC